VFPSKSKNPLVLRLSSSDDCLCELCTFPSPRHSPNPVHTAQTLSVNHSSTSPTLSALSFSTQFLLTQTTTSRLSPDTDARRCRQTPLAFARAFPLDLVLITGSKVTPDTEKPHIFSPPPARSQRFVGSSNCGLHLI